MAQKVKYICNECGYESSKWLGRCPECAQWNTFSEVKLESKKGQFSTFTPVESLTPIKIGSVKSIAQTRIPTQFEEFDRVLGGVGTTTGIVPGAVMLLSGDPGVGKSTLMLQVALMLAGKGKKVMYVTGEESESQVRMRAERITSTQKLLTVELSIISTSNIDAALETINQARPDLVIIDSIQTMMSNELSGFPGSIPQIRYATSRLVSLAKQEQIPVFLIGHVTKEGMVAGPMLLSHMVDTVLYLEGEMLTGTRILRSFKNRFGDTSEVGIFVMEEKGLIELKDASTFFMDKQNEKVPGACLTVIMEGSRPLIVEMQALVVPSSMSFPRRISNGIAERRLELLLAVIQKHVKIPVERMDVFLNVVGGLKVKETAADLAACLAVISSYKNQPLGNMVAVSEVGLLGELKSVVNLDKRIKEAKKFGYSSVVSVKDARFLTQAAQKII